MKKIEHAIKRAVRKTWPRKLSLVASNSPAQKFDAFAKQGVITLPHRPVFSRSDVFFTMGSCFAEEIRVALSKQQVQCVPRYRNIDFDPTSTKIDTLPSREHMNFYNSFTVRLQIEQMLGLWEQSPSDYWEIKARAATGWEGRAYQDPYRRMIVAKSPELLFEAIARVNREVLSGFNEATAFVFTFGMTEVFLNKLSGKAAAQKPLYAGGGGEKETVLHFSSFEENLANVRAIVETVSARKPEAKIVLTVSPVALQRTFQNADVFTVNAESKSILRAVLGQVSREYDNVIYLPSFEFVMAGGYDRSFENDRRHVERSVVSQIMDAFFTAHFDGEKRLSK